MTTREQELLDRVGDGSELAAILQKLISVPSVNGAEADCQRVVAAMLQPACDSVDSWEPDQAALEQHPGYFPRHVSFAGRPTVAGLRRGSGGGRSLILNAHVDTVEPGPPAAWRHSWLGEISGDRVYGRGAVDDKAALAISILLARCLAELDVRLKGDLIIESVCDEEWGAGGTIAALQRGYRADAAIVFEPSQLEICPGSRGGQAFRITVAGKGAHPIRAYDGVSALEKAIPILTALKDLERNRHQRLTAPLFARFPIWMPVIVGKIAADISQSKVPERCVLEGLMGYSPDETYQEARADLEQTIASVAQADPWLRDHPPLVEWHGLNKEGAQISAGHPFVRSMAQAAHETMGREPIVSGWPAGCDLPLLIKYGGIPSVVFGPGDPTVAHGSDEYVDIGEMVSAARIVALSALRWCL